MPERSRGSDPIGGVRVVEWGGGRMVSGVRESDGETPVEEVYYL